MNLETLFKPFLKLKASFHQENLKPVLNSNFYLVNLRPLVQCNFISKTPSYSRSNTNPDLILSPWLLTSTDHERSWLQTSRWRSQCKSDPTMLDHWQRSWPNHWQRRRDHPRNSWREWSKDPHQWRILSWESYHRHRNYSCYFQGRILSFDETSNGMNQFSMPHAKGSLPKTSE